MFVLDDRVIYSASDLAAAAHCEYALLRTFDAVLGWGPPPPRDEDMLARTARLGAVHETAQLSRLRRRKTSRVAHIPSPAFTLSGLQAAAEQTQSVLAQGFDAVYQAAMFDGRFLGFADFVIREEDGSYRVCDTKLARSAKVTALLQLAAYADSLATAGVSVAPRVQLILGDRSTVDYPVSDIVGVYRRRRIELQGLLDRHFTGGVAVRWEDERVRACFRCPVCRPELDRTDDLLGVAGMRVGQRAALLEAGIGTVAQLAAHSGDVPGLPARIRRALCAQARLQVVQRERGTPQFEVFDPVPLGTLPPPDPGDLFFDFEGDPLWSDDGVRWGLEYLFGVLAYDKSGAERFRPIWAHDRTGERRALVAFLDLVRERRRKHPGMHVYHYAAYEKSALLRLAGRYGIGEDQIDGLLRDNVLVDLYPLVRKSIRAGTGGYGLKALEPLFSGPRSGEVTTAVDSINEYARYCALRDAGDSAAAAAVLTSIAEYNRTDCASTRHLRDWLLVRAFENETSHLAPRPAILADDAIEDEDPVGKALTAFAGDGPPADRTPGQMATAMIAAARGYHVRERKPFWWAHFDRLNNPIDEWSDTTGVFVIDGHESVAGWHRSGGQKKMRRHLRVSGELAGGILDDSVCAVYDPPAPRGLSDGDPDRRAAGRATVLEVSESGGIPTSVVIAELAAGSEQQTFDQLPIALTPGAPIPTKGQEAAIDAVAAAVAEELPELPPTPVVDILMRRGPRTRGGTALPDARELGYPGAITAALRELDHSYLAVHGPPGTGKTSTAARVIAELVTGRGWLVGVVAQSHTVVEHLLDQVVAAGVPAERVAKKSSPYSAGAAWTQIRDSDYAGFISRHRGIGAVIGGTAWDFTNVKRVAEGSLDLLVIDEAGQFSLANTIAVARAADNLLLLGDPRQLPQVSAGTHPEPVDTSALGWLVGEHGALPAELGYFLERSYRMHPAVCQHVSRLSYDGRLLSEESVTGRRRLAGQQPGVRTVLVEHEGNSTCSPQEAQAVVEEIGRLLGTEWTDENGTRALAQEDILVVTPYNAQVLAVRSALTAAGLAAVPVGTVDKFQGRQAPVVLVSMTASAVEDVPRGMSFLLNRNRLNVAISRAQFLALIVRSPALTHYLPATPDGLTELGAFLMLSPDA